MHFFGEVMSARAAGAHSAPVDEDANIAAARERMKQVRALISGAPEAEPETPSPGARPAVQADEAATTKAPSPVPATAADLDWATARARIALGEVPPESSLPATPGNRAGIVRLREIVSDEHIPPKVRSEFLRELGRNLEQEANPPQDLHRELKRLAYGEPEKFLRKGPRIEAADFRQNGRLKRAISLQWLCAKGTDALWERAAELDDSIAAVAPKARWEHAPKVVELIRSGRLAFDPQADVDASAMVGDFPRGASGWYFAGNDVPEGLSPKELQTQLAVGPEYAAGYQIVELPESLAISRATSDSGAFRPTALDLASSEEGLLNPDASEAYGRTNPQAPGQLTVREVVVAPVPLSALERGNLVKP